MKLIKTIITLLTAIVACKTVSISRTRLNGDLSLTDLIKNGEVFTAREAAKVSNLPNAPDIESFAGYLTINDTTDSNLFFWFFPSQVS